MSQPELTQVEAESIIVPEHVVQVVAEPEHVWQLESHTYKIENASFESQY